MRRSAMASAGTRTARLAVAAGSFGVVRQARARKSFSSSSSVMGAWFWSALVMHWRMPLATILKAGAVQGFGYGGELGDDVFAVAVSFDHGNDSRRVGLGRGAGG